jgi:hypothetical protein
VFDARDIVRIGAVQVATGVVGLIEFDQIAGAEHLRNECLILRGAPIAPMDSIRLRQIRDLSNPVAQGL